MAFNFSKNVYMYKLRQRFEKLKAWKIIGALSYQKKHYNLDSTT